MALIRAQFDRLTGRAAEQGELSMSIGNQAVIDELKQQLTEFVQIAKLHQREHDAATDEEMCCCTLCHRTQLALKKYEEHSCHVCGFKADGIHEGTYYCARCLAEKQATQQSHL